MREDLLGYLLSALEPHEMRRIDERLEEDPLLREELAEVQRMLDQVDHTVGENDLVELPPGLVSRTIQCIDDADNGTIEIPFGGRSLFSPDSSVSLLRPERVLPGQSRWRWGDVLVGSFAVGVLLALTFPVLVRYRGEARKIACQDNLRQLGVAIGDFVTGRADSRLPQVAESGHEAFAGIWELRLTDRGLLTDAALRWCPDGLVPDEQCERNCDKQINSHGLLANRGVEPILASHHHTGAATQQNRGGTKFTRVGTRDLINSEHLIDAAFRGDLELLKFIQRIAGGHYAYNLGVTENGRYQTPRYEGRSSFAVLGDMPIAGRQSADGVDVTTMKWHHGQGANILYEDGSVRHVRPRSMIDIHDHPYTNHRGSIAAGVNIDDAALGASWYAPSPDAVQR